MTQTPVRLLACGLLLLSSLVVLGCAKPVSTDKADYVGEWRGKDMYLAITQEGAVSYKREKVGGTTSIDAPLQGFDGDNFKVGVGFMRTTFVVSKPPYQEGGNWKMVVDGVELTRSAVPETKPPAETKPPVEMI